MDSNFSLSYIGSLKTNLMFVFNLRDLWQAKCGNLTKREKLRLLIDSSAKYILRNMCSQESALILLLPGTNKRKTRCWEKFDIQISMSYVKETVI